MLTLLIKLFKPLLIKLLTSKLLSFLQPQLLKLDKWCEDKLGIDLIKQEKKFHEKWPNISKRIAVLERDAHPPICLNEFDGYKELEKRIKVLEEKNGIQ